MLRIAHISDLHFIHADIEEDTSSYVQTFSKLAYAIGNTLGPEVVADGHNENKLEALKNIFALLKPNIIVVTGDVTNYGDSNSFELAVARVKELQEIAGAKHVFCIPGNHDSLTERVAVLRRKGWLKRGGIKILSIFNPTAARLRKFSLDSKVKGLLKEGGGLPLLSTYQRFCVPDFGEVDPSKPIFVDAGWGEVAFFLFNSTNDPEFMANEGSIGAHQYNLLNRCLEDPAQAERIDSAVRIALLHHHPLNNPDIDAGRIDRFYNEMTDGSRFLEYLGRRKFHFILHGHQHREYMWEFSPGLRPHISAAGSALAGENLSHGSFNVIDLVTPFDAVYHRFDYKSTGFAEVTWAERALRVHSLEGIRVGEPEEDRAVQSLVAGRREGFDDKHQYELLDYEVTISPAQMYMAKYRRKGVVVGTTKSYGVNFVVTGNPPMRVEDMDVKATDGAENELFVDCLYNRGTQKVFRIAHPVPLEPGKEFDLTLAFKWQSSDAFPNYHDAVNLMYFLHPVAGFSYRVRLPWKAAQFDVTAYALRKTNPELAAREYRQNDDGTYEYLFKIASPSPLAHLIFFGPTLPH